MFSLSKQVDYGLQFLLSLSRLPPGQSLSVKQFATSRNLSFLFLQKIARQLKQAGFIDATKGAQGGYYLQVAPAALTLKHVIEAIEGRYSASSCMQDHDDCPITNVCLSKNVLFQVQADIIQTMEKYTLAEMIKM